MKRYCIFLILLLGACDLYLDKVPDDRTKITDAQAVGELLTSAYPDGNYFEFAYAMSDNADDRANNGFYAVNNDAYRYQNFTSSAFYPGSPDYYWNACYSAIAAANEALETIERIGKNDPEFLPYKGEALICRAYAHFMLCVFWGKSYDPRTAAVDLGIPYVRETENVVFKEYKRHTVKEVFGYVEKDLEEGIQLLDNTTYKVPAYHFNTRAASAFASRFYLFRGNTEPGADGKNDFDRVTGYADKALGNNPANLLRDINGSYVPLTYDEYELKYNQSSEQANLLLSSSYSSFARNVYALQRFALSADILRNVILMGVDKSEFEEYPEDVAVFKFKLAGQDQYQHFPKFHTFFKQEGLNADVGFDFMVTILLNAEEALFNKLEGLVMQHRYGEVVDGVRLYLNKRLNQPCDIDEAYIEKWGKRDRTPLKPAYTQQPDEKQLAFIKYLLHLRRIEFYYEGIRWMDIKRFHLPVIHKTIDGKVYSLKADDDRKQLPIPESAVALGLEKNAGW